MLLERFETLAIKELLKKYSSPQESRQNSVSFCTGCLLIKATYQLHIITCRFLWFQHSFVGQPGLSRSLAVELLDKVNNPDNHTHYSEADDDDFEVSKNIFYFLSLGKTMV